MRNPSVLVLVRADGWPNSVGKILLGAGLALGGLALALYLTRQPEVSVKPLLRLGAVGTLLGLFAVMLLLCRRGVTLDARDGTLTRWWGLAAPMGSVMLRQTQVRSYKGFTGLRVLRSGPTDHYKRFRRDVYHVQLEKADAISGQVGLRERIIIDDEYRAPEMAANAARQVAAFLNLEAITEVRA